MRTTYVPIFGCISIVGIVFGVTVAIAIMNPLAFSFFAIMLAGIFSGGMGYAQFKPSDAVVQNYQIQCFPKPSFVSETQPMCVVDGKNGAMLKTVTLLFQTGTGGWVRASAHYPPDWSKPPVGSHVTVFVDQRDATKFKFDPNGWVNSTSDFPAG